MRLARAAPALLFLVPAVASAQASPAAGAQLYRHCVACHALEPGRSTPAGPSLAGIVGRPVASLRGFNYSPALRRFAARNRCWTPALLDRFLADPESLVPGTEMGFLGLGDARARRTLIEWLRRRARPTG